MSTKIIFAVGSLVLIPSLTWAQQAVYPNGYTQSAVAPAPQYMVWNGQSWVVYPASYAQGSLMQTQNGQVVNSYNWSTLPQPTYTSAYTGQTAYQNYPQPTYVPQPVITTSGQCPAGTQLINTSCTKNYPNASCVNYCQPTGAQYQYPAGNCASPASASQSTSLYGHFIQLGSTSSIY